MEKITVIQIEMDVILTDEDIDDIMVSALEGGITYWCGSAEVDGEYLGEFASDQISRGGQLVLRDMEDGKKYTLTKEKFIEGVKMYLKDEGAAACLTISGNKARIDPGFVDGNAADSIIQYALFGELVYA